MKKEIFKGLIDIGFILISFIMISVLISTVTQLINVDILSINIVLSFILTIAVIGKENEVKIKGIKKLLRKLEKNEEYWSSLKEESEELYEARQELLDELLS